MTRREDSDDRPTIGGEGEPPAQRPQSERVPKSEPGPDPLVPRRHRVNTAVRRAQEEVDETNPEDEQSGERAAQLEAPGSAQVLAAVLEITNAVSAEMDREEIALTYVDVLRDLFPARRLAIRVLSPDTGELSLAHATARLSQPGEVGMDISREALELHGLSEDAVQIPNVQLVDQYVPLFEPGATGFDVPILDGDVLVGTLAVEYPVGLSEPEGDRAIVVQLALQLGSALRSERLLSESLYLREYLEKLLDRANAPIVVIGRHRDVRVVNKAFLSITGAPREEVLGRDFTHLMAEEDRNKLLPVFINALRGEPTNNHEIRMEREDGSYARISLNTASILSADGDVEAVIAIGQDLTTIRSLEEQIIQAEKLATLGQLAAGVVHELNNPLTSISVYSDYLLKKVEKGGDEGDAEKLRRIVESADRILRFTRDLVVYARPSPEEPQLISIHDVLDQSAVFCEHVIADHGTVVEKTYGDELPLVYGVKAQLHQVFINLITNACHAMPQDEGRLHIYTIAGADYLRVRLSDNGSGIPQEHARKVFEPFFSTKTEGKGTGLGLSIVRNIVQQHNGEITVTSEPGDGTTFEIVLPCPPERR